MSDRISFLPLEIVISILSHLPLESLLAFGETSRTNYRSHLLSPRGLRVGVFEKRIHSVISLLQAGWTTPEDLTKLRESENAKSEYTISVVQPNIGHAKEDLDCMSPIQRKGRQRRIPAARDAVERTIRGQNKILSKLVNRYGPSLVKLEFMAYDIDTEGAKVLGTKCRHLLRHLALRFEHSHIRDGPMRPSTWYHPTPGSSAWDLLIGIGNYKHIGISGLETLIMERSGITPRQLIMLVQKNTRLKVLKLRTCAGAHPVFLNWLGGIPSDPEEPVIEKFGPAPGAKLEVLWLQNSHQLLAQPIEDYEGGKKLPDEVYDYGLEWVKGLTSLKSLSFSECLCLSSEYVDRANKMIWKIPEVILPYSLLKDNSPIELDPLLS